ncbi:MAG: hypothetical protein Cons2KO_33650 [Congregibacter sp.]
MHLIINFLIFTILGFLLGSQFYRYVSMQKTVSGASKKIPISYWFSYIFTLAGMFVVVLIGSQFGLFVNSSYGLGGDVIPIVGALPFCYLGYRLTKWRTRANAT